MPQNLQPSPLVARRAILWRIHFWAALIASPFVLVAVLTGILYIFTPQIEASQHGWLDRVKPGGVIRPLDDSLASARAAVPSGWRLKSVLPPYAAGDTVKAVFESEGQASGAHEGHQHAPARPVAGPEQARGAPPVTVYVNPYSAQVIGSLADGDRFGNWSKRLHSRLLQGDSWRWMIELAASAMVVMLLTGIALWWPPSRDKNSAPTGARKRTGWKYWHATLGVVLSIVTVTILATGLTWSKYAGEQIRAARDLVGQAPPRVPNGLASATASGQPLLTWQAAWDASVRLTPQVAVQMTPPRAPSNVWRISAADPSQPTRRFDLVLDGFDGKQLYFAGWDQHTAFGKATAIGIPFHRGEFGVWNQAVLLLFGFGVLFSLVSGWVMYINRHRHRAFSLPRVGPGAWSTMAPPLGVATVLLCALMPVLAVAAGAVLLLELVPRRIAAQ